MPNPANKSRGLLADGVAVAGLSMVFTGLWWWCPASAMVWVGNVIFVLGVFGAMGSRNDP